MENNLDILLFCRIMVSFNSALSGILAFWYLIFHGYTVFTLCVIAVVVDQKITRKMI